MWRQKTGRFRDVCRNSTIRRYGDTGDPMVTKKNRSSLGVEFKGEQRAVITKKELIELLGGSKKYVDRMIRASRDGDPWLEFVGNRKVKGSTRLLIDIKSVERVLERIKRGETPPPMPSERKKPTITVSTKGGGIPNKQGEALIRAFDHLPKGAATVSFNLDLKTFQVTWQNGEFQWFKMRRGKGRSTALNDLTFLPPRKVSTLEPSEDPGYDEIVDDHLL